MSVRILERAHSSALVAVLAIAACACDPSNGHVDRPDGGDKTDDRTWQVIRRDLTGAVLSIWGSGPGDIWLAGADKGGGPVAMHWDGTAWSDLAPGVRGSLWWVFGPTPDEVWFSGERGLLLRYDRASRTFSEIPTGTDATLYGMWGPRDGPLYAVGGKVDGTSPGVVLMIDREARTATTARGLPVFDLDPKETFFKVWGTSANDVRVIGDKGSVLDRIGDTWSVRLLPTRPRLVTLHGSGPDDVVVVGGAGQAVVYERRGSGPWLDTSPEGVAGLNGIFVAPGGRAVAAGSAGVVLERRQSLWLELPPVPIARDWHAVWVDERGDIYVVGGRLLSVTDLDQGTVLRYGPERGTADPGPDP